MVGYRFRSCWYSPFMQVKLWYPDDAVIATQVPFYVPVKATVTDDEKVHNEANLEYTWEIDNNLLSEPIPYTAYSRKHVLCLAFVSVGLIRVTVKVTDTETGETATNFIDVFGQIRGADGIYKWDEEPIATYYDDRYVPNFTVQFRKRFKAGDEFTGAYNYFLGHSASKTSCTASPLRQKPHLLPKLGTIKR